MGPMAWTFLLFYVACSVYNYGAMYAHRQWWSPTCKGRDRRIALLWALPGPAVSLVVYHCARGGWKLR